MTTIAQRTGPSSAQYDRSARRRAERKRNLEGWLFASPWIIGFVLWTLGPMIASFILAFTEWDLVSPPRWVGLNNVNEMLHDPVLLQSLKVTTLYAIISVPLHLIIGLGLAMLLNTKIAGLRFYRTAFYLPSVLSGVAVALLWRWLFSTEFGLFNLLLSLVGIQGPSWLGSERWALPSLILMSLWGVGAGTIIYLAGLQGIPTDLYEAAEVDGARGWARFRYITLPLMTPVLFFQLIVGIIGALQIFTPALIMTNGGPNNATNFMLLYLYRNAFQYFRMGYASAIAWVLFLYILILTLLVFRSSAALGALPGRAALNRNSHGINTATAFKQPTFNRRQRRRIDHTLIHIVLLVCVSVDVHPAGLDDLDLAQECQRDLSVSTKVDSRSGALGKLPRSGHRDSVRALFSQYAADHRAFDRRQGLFRHAGRLRVFAFALVGARRAVPGDAIDADAAATRYADPAVHPVQATWLDRHISAADRAGFLRRSVSDLPGAAVLYVTAVRPRRCRTHRRLFELWGLLAHHHAAVGSGDHRRGHPGVQQLVERFPSSADLSAKLQKTSRWRLVYGCSRAKPAQAGTC